MDAIAPAQTALLVMHYQTDILGLIKQLGRFVDDRTAPELGQQANEPLIVAHRASVFFGTDLEVRLSAKGINSLIMVGIASTGVVLSSVAYASDADFCLYTVKECCYDPDPVVHEHLFATAFESRTTVLSLGDALRLPAWMFVRPAYGNARC